MLEWGPDLFSELFVFAHFSLNALSAQCFSSNARPQPTQTPVNAPGKDIG